MGREAVSSCEVFYDGLRVHVDDRVGERWESIGAHDPGQQVVREHDGGQAMQRTPSSLHLTR